MPDPLFQKLIDDTSSTRWAPTEVVHDRARQRVRRQRFATVAAAVVAAGVIGGSAFAVTRPEAAGPQPGSSTSATSSPTPDAGLGTSTPSASAPTGSATSSPPTEPTAIVNALFLQPSDVGSGYRVVTGEGGSGDWTFEFSAAALSCPRSSAYPTALARVERTLAAGAPGSDIGVTQYVGRYRPGAADRYLDDIRARVAACKPGAGRSIKIGAQRFAGQDSLMIEVNFDGVTYKNVLVRQGDLLTEFFTKPERSRADTVELAKKAAARVCGGTPVC